MSTTIPFTLLRWLGSLVIWSFILTLRILAGVIKVIGTMLHSISEELLKLLKK